MKVRNYSEHQKSHISPYYANLDAVMLQEFSEPVAKLFLVDINAKCRRLWQAVHRVMLNLKIPQVLVEHIIEKRTSAVRD